jgi:hypothetical protein
MYIPAYSYQSRGPFYVWTRRFIKNGVAMLPIAELLGGIHTHEVHVLEVHTRDK